MVIENKSVAKSQDMSMDGIGIRFKIINKGKRSNKKKMGN